MSREMKNSGIPWVGEIPSQWELVPTKRVFRGQKRIVGSAADDYERLALTMQGVIRRDKEDNEGLQPEKFDGYQVLKPNEIVFKLIDLQNVKTSRVGLSKYLGIVSPAYIIISNNQTDNRFYYYWFMDMYYRLIFNQMGDDGVRSNLNMSDVLSIPIPSIPEIEQQHIAVFLDTKCNEIDKMVALQEKIVEELKAYKQSVITETVTKGLNPDAPMKDSGIEWIGQVPKHWRIARLRNLGTTQNGISQGGDFFGEGNPFVSYSDVYKNYSLPVEVKGLAKSNEKEQGLFSVKRGDVFFTRTSETIEEIGFSSVCLETIPQAVFAGFLIRFRPNDDTLDSLFAKYYFRSDIHRAFFVKEMNIVIRASLSQDLLKSLPVLLPSKNEQHEIGAFLDERCSEIDNLISVRQAKIEALKEYKKSIIYEYVTGKKEVNG